jgi:ribosomal protein S18 acetylase RimI-like enzyme
MFYIKKLASFFLRTLQKNRLYRKMMGHYFQAVKIREAQDLDMLSVYQWFNPGADTDQHPKRSQNVHNWVAKYRGRIVGFVQLVFYFENTFYSGYWLFSLRVRTFMRGMGIGEKLCETVIEKARVEGASSLRLLVYEDNNAAVDLYKKLGFIKKSTPEIEGALSEELNFSKRSRILMEKIITDPIS